MTRTPRTVKKAEEVKNTPRRRRNDGGEVDEAVEDACCSNESFGFDDLGIDDMDGLLFRMKNLEKKVKCMEEDEKNRGIEIKTLKEESLGLKKGRDIIDIDTEILKRLNVNLQLMLDEERKEREEGERHINANTNTN